MFDKECVCISVCIGYHITVSALWVRHKFVCVLWLICDGWHPSTNSHSLISLYFLCGDALSIKDIKIFVAVGWSFPSHHDSYSVHWSIGRHFSQFGEIVCTEGWNCWFRVELSFVFCYITWYFYSDILILNSMNESECMHTILKLARFRRWVRFQEVSLKSVKVEGYHVHLWHKWIQVLPVGIAHFLGVTALHWTSGCELTLVSLLQSLGLCWPSNAQTLINLSSYNLYGSLPFFTTTLLLMLGRGSRPPGMQLISYIFIKYWMLFGNILLTIVLILDTKANFSHNILKI